MKKSYMQARRRSAEGIAYKHDLGQNFLYDETLLTRLVNSTGVSEEDGVLEIGPGAGTLTRCLLRSCRQVVAVEADHDILPFLKVATGEDPRLTVVEGDIRRVDLPALCAPLGKDFYVIANIPYNITQPILLLLWESKLPIRQISVMVQKEVAEKLLASPGDAAYGLMSLKCAFYTEARWVETVPAECFTPPPKVDSAFIRMDVRKAPVAPVTDEALLWRMIRDSFNLRRKTLQNAVRGYIPPEKLLPALESLGLSPTVRGEALTVTEWIALNNCLAERS